MKRKTVFNLLRIVISLGLIGLIAKNIDLEQLKQVLAKAKLIWLMGTVGLVFLGIAIRAKRWQILLDVFQVQVSLKELFLIYLIGFGFNNLLPSGVGGDAVRMMELNRYTNRASDAVTSVIIERFLGLYGTVLLGFIALLLSWRTVQWQTALALALVFLGLSVVGVVLIYEPLYRWLRRFSLVRKLTDIKFVQSLFESFQQYHPQALTRAFGVGLVFNGVLIGINVTIGLALGIQISLLYYLLFIPLVAVTLALPISFAGFGPREQMYILLFAQAGVLKETALALSVLVYLLGNLTPGLVGGIVYLWRGANRLRLPDSE